MRRLPDFPLGGSRNRDKRPSVWAAAIQVLPIFTKARKPPMERTIGNHTLTGVKRFPKSVVGSGVLYSGKQFLIFTIRNWTVKGLERFVYILLLKICLTCVHSCQPDLEVC